MLHWLSERLEADVDVGAEALEAFLATDRQFRPLVLTYAEVLLLKPSSFDF